MKIKNCIFFIFLNVQLILSGQDYWSLIFDGIIEVRLSTDFIEKEEGIENLVFKITSGKSVEINNFEINFALFKIEPVDLDVDTDKKIIHITLLKNIDLNNYKSSENNCLVIFKRKNSEINYLFPVFIKPLSVSSNTSKLPDTSDENEFSDNEKSQLRKKELIYLAQTELLFKKDLFIKFINVQDKPKTKIIDNAIYMLCKSDIAEEKHKILKDLEEYELVSPDEKSDKKISSAIVAGKTVAKAVKWGYKALRSFVSEFGSPNDD